MSHAIQYHRAQVTTASGLDVLAGIWLLLSPFVLLFRGNVITSNNVVLGIVIGVLALIRFFNRSYDTVWISWLNALLGIWVLISPWVLKFSTMHTAMMNNVAMGIIVILFSCWSALATVSGKDRDSSGNMMTNM